MLAVKARLAAGVANRRYGGFERAGELVVALTQGTRGTEHPAALRREQARDLGADSARGAGHHHDLAVESPHVFFGDLPDMNSASQGPAQGPFARATGQDLPPAG